MLESAINNIQFYTIFNSSTIKLILERRLDQNLTSRSLFCKGQHKDGQIRLFLQLSQQQQSQKYVQGRNFQQIVKFICHQVCFITKNICSLKNFQRKGKKECHLLSRLEQNLRLNYNILFQQVGRMGKKRTIYKKQQIPFFITKLISILGDSTNNQIVRWSDTGKGFAILNEPELIRKLLPEHFNHHNLASFIRQLNLYGFHKLENAYEYCHEYFCKAEPQKFKLIKRIVKAKKKKPAACIKRKEQKNILANNSHELDKLAEQNQKLRQENKVLMRAKTQNLRILRKLKSCARKSKKQIENALQKESKTQYTKQQEISQENIVEEQQNSVDPYRDALYSESIADELLNSYLS